MKPVAFGLLVGAVIALLIADLYLRLHEPRNPLNYPVPQPVLSQGPLKTGDAFNRFVTKCNDSKESITVRGGDTHFFRLDASGIVLNTQATSASYIVLAGSECITRSFSSPLPVLESGTWRLQGQDCVEGTKHCRSWFTGSFQVVSQ